jgi:hypothetical protein
VLWIVWQLAANSEVQVNYYEVEGGVMLVLKLIQSASHLLSISWQNSIHVQTRLHRAIKQQPTCNVPGWKYSGFVLLVYSACELLTSDVMW